MFRHTHAAHVQSDSGNFSVGLALRRHAPSDERRSNNPADGKAAHGEVSGVVWRMRISVAASRQRLRCVRGALAERCRGERASSACSLNSSSVCRTGWTGAVGGGAGSATFRNIPVTCEPSEAILSSAPHSLPSSFTAHDVSTDCGHRRAPHPPTSAVRCPSAEVWRGALVGLQPTDSRSCAESSRLPAFQRGSAPRACIDECNAWHVCRYVRVSLVRCRSPSASQEKGLTCVTRLCACRV